MARYAAAGFDTFDMADHYGSAELIAARCARQVGRGKTRLFTKWCPGQAVYILDKIAASIAALGGSLDDVVRTRVYLRDAAQWEAASRVHGRYFNRVRPANTLIEISGLVGDYEVEIEAEAVVDTTVPR